MKTVVALLLVIVSPLLADAAERGRPRETTRRLVIEYAPPMLSQGYESFAGSPRLPETICTKRDRYTIDDRYTFTHPDLGPDYVCRRLP